MKHMLRYLAALLLSGPAFGLAAGCSPASVNPPQREALASPAAPAPLTVAERIAAPAGVTAVKMSNGTVVIVKPIRTSPVVAVRAYVHAGSLYEGPWLGCGLSHLVEHLVAGGEDEDANSGAKAKQTSAKIGGQSNAYTSMEMTCYYIEAAAGKTPECIDYVAGMMAAPDFTEQDFIREHGVVQREREEGLDSPDRQLGEAHNANVYRTHPAAVPIIGYQKPLADLKWDDVLRYHGQMYVGQNVVFVVAGDVDVQKVLDRCAVSLAGLSAGRQPDLTLPDAQDLSGVSRARLAALDKEVKETREEISFLSIPLLHEDLYALDLLATILAEGQYSRLDQKIHRQLKLVTSISAGSWTPDWGRGEFSISFRSSPEQGDAAEAAIMEEIKLLLTGGVKDEELTRAKRIKVADLVYSQQTAESQAAQLATDYLTTGDLDFSVEYTKKIQSVTAEQVQEAAQRYLKLDAMAITRMDPSGAPPAAATGKPAAGPTGAPAGAASAPSTQPAPAATAKEESRLLKLPSGLRVVLHPTKAVGLVSMVMVGEGGLLLETPKTNGLGTLMTALSTKGAGERSADQISEFFDLAGGGISASCNNNTFVWDATVLDDSFEKALEVFADVVQRPAYPAKELDIYRKGLLAGIARIREDPKAEAFKLAREKFFTNSPYGMLPIGTADVVQAATVEQIAQYHKDNVKAGTCVLSIYGNFDADAAAKKIESLFAGLPTGKVEPKLADFRTGSPGDRLVVEPTHKENAVVVAYQPGMTVQNIKDRLPIDVLDTIISGYQMPSGWLHNELRGKQLVYEVHATNMVGLSPGAFVTYAVGQPEKAPEVVRIIRKDLDRAAQYTPTAAQVEEAVNTILTAELLDSQHMKDLALTSALNELYGLGYDFLQKMEKEYRQITPDDVHRVAQKYFGKGYFMLVTTPKPDAFGKADAGK
jgi:zinc protease